MSGNPDISVSRSASIAIVGSTQNPDDQIFPSTEVPQFVLRLVFTQERDGSETNASASSGCCIRLIHKFAI